MTKKLQHLLAALLFAAALGPAQALTLNIGDLLTEGSVTLSRAFNANKSFMDVFNFTLSGESAVTFDWSSLGIGGLKLSAPVGLEVAGSGSQLTTDPLTAGSYMASLTGTATPGDTYSITISTLSAAPVPEPGTWALFAAGIALLGFIARRRLQP